MIVTIRGFVFAALAVFLSASAWGAEEITITTYYPSPQGVYKNLKAKQLAVGDTYYGLKWQPETGGTISAAADMVVEGRVGIGTITPNHLLSVSSNTTGIYAIEMNRTNTDTNDYNTWRLWNMNSLYGYGFEIWQYPLVPASYGGNANIRRFEINATGDTYLTPSGGSVIVGGTTVPAFASANNNIHATGEIISNKTTGHGQFRAISGSYGAIFRNDGNDFYMLLTNASNQYGIWNDYRPFRINMTNGNTILGYSSVAPTNVGINTLSPQVKLHIKGNAGIMNLEGSDHVYMQFYPDGYAAGRERLYWL